MRIASAQINSILGDFKKNAEKILEFTKRAVDKRCELVVFPELSLFGYWPSDLIERKSNIDEQLKWLKWLEKKMPKDISILVGVVTKNEEKFGKLYRNSAALITSGKKTKYFHKELLPTYDVFDESRYFEPGDMSDNTFSFKGKKVLVTICEDIWASGEAWVGTRYPKNPLLKLKGKKIDIAINLSASPFSRGKAKSRLKVAKAMVDILKAPVVYTNMVGAQDEVIFDGNSFAMKKSGKVVMNSSPFQEDLNIVDFPEDKGGWRESISEVESLRQALVLGIRDFAFKTGIERVHLGLSGGVDSAVVACLAVDAMGPNKVTMIAMPGPFSSEKSLELAKALSKNLGASLITSEINSQYEVLIKNLERDFSHSDFGLVNENAQARLRAVNLMAFANLKNSLLLNTSNKTEMAVGYSTLYGDLCGGLCPIGDLLKTEVYELARHYNMESELIPGEIISRPPTAELKANQKDSDSLPEYDILDEAVKKIVVECKPAKTEIEKWLLKKIRSSEFKRWQAPPVLRVSQHAFGRGRRVPIAHQAEF